MKKLIYLISLLGLFACNKNTVPVDYSVGLHYKGSVWVEYNGGSYENKDIEVNFTLSEDGDPLDVLVMCSESILNCSLVRCFPIGVISMEDGGEMDEKIIALPFSDPSYSGYKSIHDLPEHMMAEMEHFFTVYKQLEGKKTYVSKTEGHVAAREVIARSIRAYNEKFGG